MSRPRSGEAARSATHVSLERGLRLVETVALNEGAISLAEAARRKGLHRSTAYHLLQTLVGLDHLRQDPESQEPTTGKPAERLSLL